MKHTLWTRDEWSPLQECILGTAKEFNLTKDISHYVVDWHDSSWSDYIEADFEYITKDIIAEAEADLNYFQTVLRTHGVVVHRPQTSLTCNQISNGMWETGQMQFYNVRDIAFVIDNTIVESAMSVRTRYFEQYSIQHIFKQKFLEGAKWLSMPKPKLSDDHYSLNVFPDIPTHEPLLDGANILRMGDDLLVSTNLTANKMGVEWLRRHFPNHRIHEIDLTHKVTSHIDTTFTVLKEGVVLINEERIKEDEVPDLFKDWTKVFITKDIIADVQPKVKKGIASKWVGMNMFSIDPNNVCVDASQERLMEVISQYVNPIPIPMKHSRILGGGLHCCTLDLLRN